MAVTVFCVFWALAFLAAGAIRTEGPRVSFIGLTLLLVAVVNNANWRSTAPKQIDRQQTPPRDTSH
jgi:hypothetical protein